MNSTGNILNRVTLYAIFMTTAFLFASSYFVESALANDSIPHIAQISLAGIGIVLLLLSLFYIGNSFILRIESKFTLLLLAAFFLFSSPMAITGYRMVTISILLLWAHYCLLQNQYFTAFFILGIGTIIFPPLAVLYIIVQILLLFSTENDKVRFILKSVSGYLLPLIFWRSYYFLTGRDSTEIVGRLASIAEVSLPFSHLSITFTALIVILTVLSVSALYTLTDKASTSGSEEAHILHHQAIYFLVAALIAAIYSNNGAEPVNVLLAPAISIILFRFLEIQSGRRWVNIAILMTCALLIMQRVEYFI